MPPQAKTRAKGEGQKYTFKLLAGLHIQADPDWEPSEQDRRKAEMTGLFPKAPSKQYKGGEVVVSDTDLAAKHGREKYQLISGPEDEKYPRQNAAPAGQVSEGFQVTSGELKTEESAEEFQIRAESAKHAAQLAAGPSAVKDTSEAARLREAGRREHAEAKASSKSASASASASTQSEDTAGEESQELTEGDLNKMNKAELTQVAKDNDTDLSGCSTRQEMINRIMGR